MSNGMVRWSGSHLGSLRRFGGSLDSVTETMKRTAVVGGTALSLGVLNGKTGGKGASVFGVPADLLAGVAGHALAAFGTSQHADTFRSIGDGGLASYLSTVGVKLGNNWKVTGKLINIKGDDDTEFVGGLTTGGASLADEELARMVSPEA